MPLVSEISWPALMGQPVPKPRRRPAYGYSRVKGGRQVKLGRRPTAFEEQVISLSEIPVRLNGDIDNLMAAITLYRRNGLADVPTLEALLLDAHARSAAYGAEERLLEWHRQGRPVDPDAPTILGRVQADARLKAVRDATITTLIQTWTNLRDLMIRQVPAPKRSLTIVDEMLDRHVEVGLRPAARGVINSGFAAGRTFEQQRLVSLKAVQPDMLVFTAVLDANTCGECEDADGTTFEEDSAEADEFSVPYYLCESTASGHNLCRCIQVAVDSEPGWVNAALDHLAAVHLSKRDPERYDLDGAAAAVHTPRDEEAIHKKAWDTRGRAEKMLTALHTSGVDAALAEAPEEFRTKYTDLMTRAPEAHADLHDQLDTFVGNLGGVESDYSGVTEGPGIEWVMGPIKGGPRVIEKAVKDYQGDVSRVQDIVRASVVADTREGVKEIATAISDNFDVVRMKNRYEHPGPDGYRDFLFNVRLKNGMIGEIQVHYKPLLRAKNAAGWKLYEQMRQLFGDPAHKKQIHDLIVQSQRLYNQAYES